MSEPRKAALFGDLGEQRAPERQGGGAPRLRTPERSQVELRAISLEELLPSDHRARFVWSFVERLDLSVLYQGIKAVEGRPGHPSADPRLLVALWLYATMEQVGSARELARLCAEHVGFEWLCGGVGMNHKTLSDFRVGHGAVLEQLLVDSFAAVLKTGQASLARVAQDGMRVRACAGAASFRRLRSLRQCREEAEKELRRLRQELDADPGTLSRRQAAARERAAEDRRRRVEAAVAVAERLHGGKRAEPDKPSASEPDREPPVDPCAAGPRQDEPRKEPRVSTTDPEARVMKMADGGFRPAYNLGIVADTRSGMIAGVAVDNVGSDMGKLAPMNDQLAQAYGQRPAEHLADGGFAKLADIEALAALDVTTFVPVPTPRDKERDRHAPLPHDSAATAAWRERMGSDAAKEIYKERAATIECVNAKIRNHGLLRFTVRGLPKVVAVTLWHALAHNMMCGWRLQAA